MQGKISQKVFEKITTEQINMKPKTSFLVDFLFWISLTAIAFFSSAIILGFVYHYWMDGHLFSLLIQQPGVFFRQFPYYLALLAAALLYLSARLYRRSRKRCRHEDWALISAMLLTALLTGILFMQLSVFSNMFHSFATELFQRCVL